MTRGATYPATAHHPPASALRAAAVALAALAAAPASAATLALGTATQPAGGTLAVAASAWTQVGAFTVAASSGTLSLDSVAVANAGAAPQATAGDLELDLVNGAGGIYATGRWDGSRWVFGAISDPSSGQAVAVGTTPTTFYVYATAQWGAAPSETFAMQVSPANVVSAGATGGTTGSTVTGNAFTTAAPASVYEGSTTNAAAPLVSIVNPGKGTVVGGTSVLVQIYVVSQDGSAVSAVGLTADGSKPACTSNDAAITKDAHTYANGNAAMYQKLVSLAAGPHLLQACAASSGGTIVSAPVNVDVRAAAGDGNLLVRDDGAQLCADCHAGVKTHSSESNTKYGTWSTACRDCHTPHSTRNLYLVRERIVPPSVNGYQSTKNVYFATKVGDSNVSGASTPASSSFVNADASGPCQACHTRTQSSTGVARWRNTGNSDTHYTAAAGTQACTNCHSHESGFEAGESGGGSDCGGCHGDLFTPMNGTASGYHHYLNDAWSGTTAGSGTTSYPTTAWTASTSDTNRRCLACHVDHDVFRPDLNPSGARAKNLRTDYGLVPSKTANFTGTDFDATLANGGVCLSCHGAAQTKSYAQADGSTTTPALSKTAFAASVHDYAATSTFKDASSFSANCSKCHTDTNAKAKQTSAYPNQFGLHDALTRRISNRVGDTVAAGTAAGAQSATTLQDTSRTWTANQWAGYAVTIRDASGTRTGVVKANTSTTLSLVDPWTAAPVSGTTTYTLDDPMEERLCTQCHSGGTAGNDAFGAKAMSATARSFDQYLRVYGAGTVGASSTTLTGTGTAWYASGSGATFTSGSQTVSGLTGVTSAMLGWSIKNTAVSPPRWYSIVATPSATSVTVSPAYQGTTASGAGWAISIGDWYFRCDADTTGEWYRVTDVGSATSATIYPAYGGATCSGSGYVVRSSPGHPMSLVAGRHRPDEATTAGWNAGSTRHVTCEDCHDPHQAQPGRHTPGSTSAANLGAVNTGTWGVSVAYASRTCTGSFTGGGTTVTTGASCFASTDVGKNISVTDGTGASFALAIKTYGSATSVTTTLYHGASISNATFTIGDPTAAPTLAKVTSLSTSSAQYQLCLKCHSPYGYGSTPPSTSFFSASTYGNGATGTQSDVSKDFNPFQLGYHPIMAIGRNQPPSTANGNWATSAGRKVNAPNTGLDNTFVDGWGAKSLVTCTDCHQSESANDPWGPHGTANQWLLKGIDPNVTVTTTNGVTYPNACYYRGTGAVNGSSVVPDTGDSKNLCLNCHRADVYGIVTSGGSSTGTACNGSSGSAAATVTPITYANLGRVNHPVDARLHSNATSQGDLTRFGIYCMICHGGESIGAIHGTNDGAGPAGGSYRGKRLLASPFWTSDTRATIGAGVTCTTKSAPDQINTCARGHSGSTGNKANYDYDSGAD